ncbi:hypothetical protein VNO77_33540 [Canavalia gladiata]|uniref:Uncharacterized protein n=1 Tax=Canavalia gladiata TaxID=3824 RepID=A0AAN9KE34_CANGL
MSIEELFLGLRDMLEAAEGLRKTQEVINLSITLHIQETRAISELRTIFLIGLEILAKRFSSRKEYVFGRCCSPRAGDLLWLIWFAVIMSHFDLINSPSNIKGSKEQDDHKAERSAIKFIPPDPVMPNLAEFSSSRPCKISRSHESKVQSFLKASHIVLLVHGSEHLKLSASHASLISQKSCSWILKLNLVVSGLHDMRVTFAIRPCFGHKLDQLLDARQLIGLHTMQLGPPN